MGSRDLDLKHLWVMQTLHQPLKPGAAEARAAGWAQGPSASGGASAVLLRGQISWFHCLTPGCQGLAGGHQAVGQAVAICGLEWGHVTGRWVLSQAGPSQCPGHQDGAAVTWRIQRRV